MPSVRPAVPSTRVTPRPKTLPFRRSTLLLGFQRLTLVSKSVDLLNGKVLGRGVTLVEGTAGPIHRTLRDVEDHSKQEGVQKDNKMKALEQKAAEAGFGLLALHLLEQRVDFPSASSQLGFQRLTLVSKTTR
jgi:hypothetical protein